MMRSILSIGAVGFAGSLLGCSEPSLEGFANVEATERGAIVNGTLSSPDDNAVVSVVGGSSGCTGTLIAPTVVLTALHCLTNFSSQALFACNPDGTLKAGSTAGQLGAPIDTNRIRVQVGLNPDSTNAVRAKQIFSTGSTDACHDDLAVITLQSAPDIGDARLVALRFNRPTLKNQMMRIVGYGDVQQTDTERGRQVRTGIKVRGVGGPDGSTPGDPNALPKTVLIGEGPCHGDSGGPIFSEETGAQVGVYSILHNTTCTGSDVRNTYTQVLPFEPLIRQALEAEGYEPIVEPPAPVTGEGGGAGEPGEVPGTGGSGAVGGSEATGGTGAVGGSDGVGGSGAVGGTSDGSGGTGNTSGTMGEGAAPNEEPNEGEGTGSRRDGSCTCRVPGSQERGVPSGGWALAAVALAIWTAARRRGRAS